MKKKEIKFAFVDDEAEMNLELAEAILKKNGYSNIDLFKTGIDFLNHYEKKDITSPDIAFLDLKLPEIDGLKVLELACQKEKFSGTIFVALSNYIPSEHEEWLADSGFHDVMIKPINGKKLLEKIETLIVKRDKTDADRIPCKKPNAKQQEVTRLKIEKEELIKDYIEKLISPKVFKILESSPNSLKPKFQEIAIGFVDIRGFTNIVKEFEPEQINYILGLFFQLTCRCIKSSGGFVDAFTGDGVMWIHEGPSIKENSEQCIEAAIKMIKGIEDLNEEIGGGLGEDDLIQIGIGLACGKVVLGIVGDRNYRIQYTAIGRAVNLASRLCDIAPKNQIIIGGEIISLINDN
jgi:class 3 adenylate cyclase/AmiR/NasT family two-component response regulator